MTPREPMNLGIPSYAHPEHDVGPDPEGRIEQDFGEDTGPPVYELEQLAMREALRKAERG